jgi:hypothetical protein
MVVSWNRSFDKPVSLGTVGAAQTLRDAAAFIGKLPQAQRQMPEWQIAMQTLIAAAENHGPMMFAELCLVLAVRAKHQSDSLRPD